MSFVDAFFSIKEDKRLTQEIKDVASRNNWNTDELFYAVFYFIQAFSTGNIRINKFYQKNRIIICRHIQDIKTHMGKSISLSAAIIAAKREKERITSFTIKDSETGVEKIAFCSGDFTGNKKAYIIQEWMPKNGLCFYYEEQKGEVLYAKKITNT